MAERREITSQPFILRQTKPDGGIKAGIYYTLTTGDVDGDIFKPPGNDTTARIDIYSRASVEEYKAVSLRNPTLVNETSDGEPVILRAIIQNGNITPTAEATQEELKDLDKIRTSAIEASVSSIKGDEQGLKDGSNLTPNVETSQPTIGDNAVKGTPAENKPSERGGSPTTFSYPTSTRREGDGGTVLYYPQNITDEQDKIEFSVWQYNINRRSIDNPNTNLSAFGFDQEKKVEDKDYTLVNQKPTVFLPISNKIMDSNGVTWNEDSFNDLQRIAANMSLGMMNTTRPQNNNSPPPTVEQQFENSVKSAMGTQFGNAVRTWLAGKAVGVNGLLTRATGAAINPNLELLFQSPQLRAFQFQFLLIGKSENESIRIKKIIKFFKENMAVRTRGIVSGEKSMAPTFLNSPYVFGIRYLNGQSDHQSINKIKKCALQNFTVDYTPMGSYMTYTDGSMFAYSLSMQFKELTPIYDIDYDESHSIGY